MPQPTGPDSDPEAGEETDPPPEPDRRFTAPSAFDVGSTQIMVPPPEPATEIFSMPPDADATAAKPATPRLIPPRGRTGSAGQRRSWGWVIALLLVIAALVAVAILGTIWLTRDTRSAAGMGAAGMGAAGIVAVPGNLEPEAWAVNRQDRQP